MLTLYLIRHGIAEGPRPGLQDAERALTDSGKRLAVEALRTHLSSGSLPESILVSPYRRAQETCQCLLQVLADRGLPELQPETWDSLLPGGGPNVIESRLRALEAEGKVSCLAMISHQPLCSALIAHLTGRQVPMREAACATLRLHEGHFSLESA